MNKKLPQKEKLDTIETHNYIKHMSKKHIKPPQTPAIYTGLDENKAILAKHCLVIQPDGHILRFSTPQEDHTTESNRSHKFPNWNTFEETVSPKETLEWHQRYFEAMPPEGQTHTMNSLYVWLKMCSLSVDRTSKPRDPITGARSKSTARLYTRLFGPDGYPTPSPLKTPQAMACLAILDSCCKENIRDGKKSLECLETDLKKLIYERQAELKTKQDAWRIFQYYRPQLIANKIITLT